MQGYVLIVEEDQRTREALGHFLERVGLSVCAPCPLADVLAGLACAPPLALIDLYHADAREIRVLEAIRALGLHTKVAVITSGMGAQLSDRVRLLRPDAIFGKPLDFDDLADWFCKTLAAPAPCAVAA